MKYKDRTPEWREARSEYLKKRRSQNPEKYRERSRERYAENPEKYNERNRKWKDEHRERHREVHRKYRTHHDDEIKEYKRKRKVEHREELIARQRKRLSEEINSAGVSKNYIRLKSKRILYRTHSKIQGYEIHHCFGYDDPDKFIYIPSTLHVQIHNFLRDNKISVDSNHWNSIRDLVNSYEGYTYIRT